MLASHWASPVGVDIAVVGLSLLVVSFVLAHCAKARRSDVLDLIFSLLVTTACVVSYHFFVHNATILLLPVLLTTNHIAGSERHTVLRVPFWIAVTTMYLAPFVIPEPFDMLVFFGGSVLLLVALYRSTTQSQEISSEQQGVVLRHSTAELADHAARQ
jgi:hypothetical protein